MFLFFLMFRIPSWTGVQCMQHIYLLIY
uniref:Uncharacterized protein n=1 Tax=Anguilla anguilla TaxID=7936 RepID=A0A0E9VWS8_ANGAN